MSAPEMETLLHVLDLMIMKEWDEAKGLLEPFDDDVAGRLFLLVCDLEQNEQRRARALSVVRHEIGNTLSIARANLEGIADGVLAPTPDRIEGIVDSLSSAGRLLDDLRRFPESPGGVDVIRLETFDIDKLISAHAAAIAGLARAKNVRVVYDAPNQNGVGRSFRGDPSRVGQALSNALLNAVRYTPPGGTVHVRSDRAGSEITLEVRESDVSVVPRLLKVLGDDARVESSGDRGAIFAVTLPATPLANGA
jgi:two-component system sensor histidine kinase BaeS